MCLTKRRHDSALPCINFRFVSCPREVRHLQRNEYQIKIPYRDDAELDKIVGELLYESWLEADRGNCFSESEASLEGTDRAW